LARPVRADFGASKAFQGDTITDGMKSIKGSAFWMAPEVIKGTGAGVRDHQGAGAPEVIRGVGGCHGWGVYRRNVFTVIACLGACAWARLS